MDVVRGIGAIKVCLDLESVEDNDNGENYAPILYSKPLDEFHHPNRNTMPQAFNRMMNRLKVVNSMDSDNGKNTNPESSIGERETWRLVRETESYRAGCFDRSRLTWLKSYK